MPTKEQRQPCLIIVKQEPTDCIQNEETKKPENVQQLTNTTNTTAAKNQESIQNMPTIEHRRPSLFVVKQEPVDINCIQNERTEEKEYFQPHIFTNNTKSAVNQESIQSIIPTSKPIMNTVSPSFIRPALKLPIQLRLTLVNNIPTLVPICPETQMQLPHSQQQVVFGSNQSIQQLPVTFQNSNSSNGNKASSVLQSNIMQMPIIQQRSNSCKNVQLKKLAPKDPKLVVEKEWSVTKQNYTTKKLSNPKLDFEKEWAVTKKNYTAKKLTNPKLDFEKEWSVTKQNTTTKKLSNQKLVIEKEMSVTKQNCITDNYSEVSASPAPEEMYVVNDEGLVQQRFQQNEQIPTVKELLSELQNNSSAENLSNPDVDQTGVKDTRFQRITAEKLNELQEGIEEARSTKRNTKWGVKMFQAWSLETTGSEVDFHTISKEDLNEKLKYFYAETKPLKRTCRTAMKSYQSAIYKKNTMKNVRAALNRHLQNINRDFDIVRGSAFKESNALLYTKMKLLAKNGLLPPTKHKVVIDTEDLRLINNYVYQTNFDSVSLRFRVWYCIAIHFVSLPIDFQHQLTMNSFGFNRDKEGKEYAYIQQVPLAPDKLSSSVKNGVASCEEVMYASPGKGFCPVAALRLMIMKTDPSATSLFNRRQTERRDDSPEFWYTNQCVGKRSFSQFMSDICKQANCKLYTAGCLRATALRARTDPDLGHIMYNTR